MKAKPKSGIEQKIERIKDALNRIEMGLYSDFTIYECCDYIAWLAQYKKVPKEVWGALCDKATEIMEVERARG